MSERLVPCRLRRRLAAFGGALFLVAWPGAHAADDSGDACATLAVNLGLVLNDEAQWTVDSQKVADATAKWYAQGSDAYAQFNIETAEKFAEFAATELGKKGADDKLEEWVPRIKKDLLAINETMKISIAQRGGRKLTQAEARQLETLLAAELKAGEVGAWAEKYVAGTQALEGAAMASFFFEGAELIFERAADAWDLHVAASAVDDAQLMQRSLADRQRAILDRVTALKRQTIGTRCPWPSDFQAEWQLASGQGVTTGNPLANLTGKVQSIRHALETESTRCAAGVHGEAHGPNILGAGMLGATVGGILGAAVGGNASSIKNGIAIGGTLGAGAAFASRAKASVTRQPRSGTDATVCSQLDGERQHIDQTLAGLVNGTACRPDSYAAELSCAYQMRDTMPVLDATLQTIVKTNQRTCAAIGTTLKPKKPAAESENKMLFPTQESIDSCLSP